MENSDKQVLAWAAGFLDGDAYLGIVASRTRGRPHPRYRLNLPVTQNDLAVLQVRLARSLVEKARGPLSESPAHALARHHAA